MENLVAEIFSLMSTRRETLAVAESCTGGGLANCITEYPGISQIFLGSMTTYANSAKEALLNIPKDVLLKKGAVSEDVALLMAENCRTAFSSTWALSTTGIAGPGGGTEEKPVGLVYIGIAGPKMATAHRFNFAPCTRRSHREKTIHAALTMLLRALNDSSNYFDGTCE